MVDERMGGGGGGEGVVVRLRGSGVVDERMGGGGGRGW